MKTQRAKGAAFERVIAKAFSKWYGLPFVRTPLSGGWGKAQTKGDVLPTLPNTVQSGTREYVKQRRKLSEFPFVIECKHDKAWSIDAFIQSPSRSTLARHFQQACEGAADVSGKVPMLIAKQNGREPVVFVPLVFSTDEVEGSGCLSFLFSSQNFGIRTVLFSVMLLEDFLMLSPRTVLLVANSKWLRD